MGEKQHKLLPYIQYAGFGKITMDQKNAPRVHKNTTMILKIWGTFTITVKKLDNVILDIQSKDVPDVTQWFMLFNNVGTSIDLSCFFRSTISWLA